MKMSVKSLSQQLHLFLGFQLFIIIIGLSSQMLLEGITLRLMWVSLLSLMLISLVIFYSVMRSKLVSSIYKLQDFSEILIQGDADKDLRMQGTEETEELAKSLNVLNQKLKDATQFVKQIGERNFEAEMQQGAQDADKLTLALLDMRDKLRKLSDDEDQRTWINQNIAKFGEILRMRNEELKEFTFKIISELVKVLKINQGFLFVINDDNESDVFLELKATHAYDRRKFIRKRIEIGEGLVGQTYLEKRTTYLTEIPLDYLTISSGAIEAKPVSLLIVPIMSTEGVQGVVELVSLKTFQPYQIEFVEKIGESIAITIGNLKVNERTKILLENSQKHSEELQSREEELRQNMEEMQATQEEIARQQNITEGLINNSSDTILIIDNDLRIMLFNNKFREVYAQDDKELRIGVPILNFVPNDEKDEQVKLYQRALEGENFTEYKDVYSGEIDHRYEINYFPLRHNQGKIIGACVVARDISERKVEK